MPMQLHRAGIYQIEEVLPYVVMGRVPHGEGQLAGRPQRIYDGKTVHMDSKRYQTFVNSGTVCVACGLQATYFALERQINSKRTNRYHFNLYGVRDGVEILFTKDHVVPRARGGSNDQSNLQTMCQPCNTSKGHECKFTDWYARTRSKLKHLRHQIQQNLTRLKAEKRTLGEQIKTLPKSNPLRAKLHDGYPVLKAKREELVALDQKLFALDKFIQALRKTWLNKRTRS